jgi:hypothetical protein
MIGIMNILCRCLTGPMPIFDIILEQLGMDKSTDLTGTAPTATTSRSYCHCISPWLHRQTIPRFYNVISRCSIVIVIHSFVSFVNQTMKVTSCPAMLFEIIRTQHTNQPESSPI